MLWLIAIGCLAVGSVAGFLIAGQVNTKPNKVAELEQKLQDLQRNHSRYRDEVSEHFSTTAELVQQMTDSYKDVYQHLASGAQELCSGEVASKLLPTSNESVFGNTQAEGDGELQAPKDYAQRQSPTQVGALAEEFGLEKLKKEPDDE